MSTLETLQSTAPATDKLASRVAFVTGGTRGIGAAVAHSLANQGASVAVGYSRNPASAEHFVADLRQATEPHGAAASAHRGNVGSAADCRSTIAEVIETHGRLDILVNNAGITMDCTVAEMTEEQWSTVLAVNLSGAFFLSPAARGRPELDIPPTGSASGESCCRQGRGWPTTAAVAYWLPVARPTAEWHPLSCCHRIESGPYRLL
ncbi:SDR family NAD(P)-dependent oxidoreductase [Nocardia sp. NBC_01009]|uniref:SDR family NAD(P)-dependent oxidoreductase n=1 Tax=Nocardia sp. NBC_01009 TaxID=2975996 RepID=UPI0038670A15|nr:SDR family NAD(P)-dependent oxidoreductase [Nocardia sp. NBC_01009]